MEKIKDPLVYKIIRPIAKVIFKILYRPKVIGKNNIPKKGRIVIAGNHKNNFDCAMMLISTRRCIHFLAKEELFNGKFGWFFKSMGLIPVKRKTHDGKALPLAIKYLEKDKVIGIFPEGTFNRSDDPILPFKIGAVKMAHDANSKIVPFVIKGEYRIFRKGLTIEFFEPISIESDDLDKENEKFMKLISDKLTDREV
jgi:1-acyl-sn-glycerol-3-phosphate acyltransferase